MNGPLSQMPPAGSNVGTQHPRRHDLFAELMPQTYMTTEEARALPGGLVQGWLGGINYQHKYIEDTPTDNDSLKWKGMQEFACEASSHVHDEIAAGVRHQPGLAHSPGDATEDLFACDGSEKHGGTGVWK